MTNREKAVSDLIVPQVHGRTKILSPGTRLQRLTVLGGPFCKTPKGVHVYLCRCDCGALKLVPRKYFDRVKSCGCERAKHRRDILNAGYRWSPSIRRTFFIWRTMHSRCANNNSQAFHRYGARGIKVCRRWNRFVNFLQDMGTHKCGLSLERTNNDGPYSPSNCRWATKIEQARNTSANRRIFFAGESMILADWSKRTGIKAATISRRLELRWSIKRALTQEVR